MSETTMRTVCCGFNYVGANHSPHIPEHTPEGTIVLRCRNCGNDIPRHVMPAYSVPPSEEPEYAVRLPQEWSRWNPEVYVDEAPSLAPGSIQYVTADSAPMPLMPTYSDVAAGRPLTRGDLERARRQIEGAGARVTATEVRDREREQYERMRMLAMERERMMERMALPQVQEPSPFDTWTREYISMVKDKKSPKKPERIDPWED